MIYRRFVLEDTPATLATSATLRPSGPQIVADVASVAARNLSLTSLPEPTVAGVANVAGVTGNSEKSAQVVPPAEIAIAIERAASRLKSSGTPSDCIVERATAMVRSNLRNDPRLCERQPDPRFCHVCNHRAEPDRPLVPISTPEPGRHYWLHGDCWPEHARRIRGRLDAIMGAAAPI